MKLLFNLTSEPSESSGIVLMILIGIFVLGFLWIIGLLIANARAADKYFEDDYEEENPDTKDITPSNPVVKMSTSGTWVDARAGNKSNVEFPKEPVISTEFVPKEAKETIVQSKYSGPKYSRISNKEIVKYLDPRKKVADITEMELNTIMKHISTKYRDTKVSPYIFYYKGTIAQLAKSIGVPSATLSKYLDNDSTVPIKAKGTIDQYLKENIKNFMLV